MGLVDKKEYVYFDDIDYQIRRCLSDCRSSLKVCVAWISWDRYGRIFKALAEKGVKVEIIYNDDHINQSASMLEGVEGISLYAVSARRRGSLMHNKFCIIDDRVLLTGSFNWSRNAETHFENIVVLVNHYKIIKEFMHEFEDLKFYFDKFGTVKARVCGSDEDGGRFPCRSHTYNVGILGGARGYSEDSTVHVWRVCGTYKHASMLSESEEICLNSNLLGDGCDSDFYDDAQYGQGSMFDEFDEERGKVKRLVRYFKDRHGIEVHAVGYVVMLNDMEHIEYNEDPEYGVNFIWRDMYYRKIIPSQFCEGESDGVDEIISTSLRCGCYD